MLLVKKLLAIVVLSLLWNGSASADQAQLFGIKLYKDLFQSIDKDTWLKEKCINKSSYSAFIRYQEVPLYNDMFPVVKAEVDKCKVFGVWGQGFFKKKSKCRKNITCTGTRRTQRTGRERGRGKGSSRAKRCTYSTIRNTNS